MILDNIPFQIDLDDLMQTLHVKAQSRHTDELVRLAQAAQAIGRPKAMYKVAYIESKGEDTIATDGVVFTSRVLRVNLEQVHKVFPYVVTCGVELEEWSRSIEDLLQHFWAEAVNEWALRSATQFLEKHLVEQYQLGQTSTMNPGSLEDWPLQEQRKLFALLGDPQAAIGVRLTDGLLMVPTKSVSGIRFPTETQLCQLPALPARKLPGTKSALRQGLVREKISQKRGLGKAS